MKVHAHRGIHNGKVSDENSKKAIEKTLTSNADGIEVDLQLLKNGDFLLFHDDFAGKSFKKIPEHTPLNSLNPDEIASVHESRHLTLRNFMSLDFRNKEVILECKPSKNRDFFARSLVQTLDKTNCDFNIIISSQDLQLLSSLNLRSTFPTAPVIYEIDPLIKSYIKKSRWNNIHLSNRLCRKDVIDTLQEVQPEDIIAWTVNTQSRLRELERIGIKGIMTDNIELFNLTSS